MSCYICHTTRNAYINRENNVKLHMFPISRPTILEEWKKFARVAKEVDVTRITLCTKHFKEEDIISHPLKTTLLKTAIPCLLPPEKQSVWCITSLSPTNDDVQGERMSREYPEEHIHSPDGLQVLENVRKQLCRICGKKEALLMPIFEIDETDSEIPLMMKIEMYLPVKVEVNDALPPNICSKCFDLLQRWDELHVTCLSADGVLRRIFCDTDSEMETKFSCELATNINDSVKDETGTVLEDDGICDNPVNQVNTNYVVPIEETMHVESIDAGVTHNDVLHNNKYTSYVKPFLPRCSYCRELFYYSDDCKNHIHECQELPALCDVCGEEIPHRKHLCQHKRRHASRKLQSFFCEKCAKYIHSVRAFKYHMKFIHDKRNPPRYCCEPCCKVMYTKFCHQLHMKEHASGRIKNAKFSFVAILQNKDSAVYLCPVCDDVFGDKLSLIVHLTAETVIKCPTCQKISQSEKKFILHKCRKWYCHDCAQPFNNKHAFEAHLHIHKEIPSNIEVCI